jgi:hypothetical protein
MMSSDLGVQLGQLVFETTMESVGEAALLTGEDPAKALIEYLTLMQFSTSRRVAILFSDASIDSVLDDIRRTGMDLLEDQGLALSRDKIEKFQRERFGQYYAAVRQDASSRPSEVMARMFLRCCASCPVSSGPVECGDTVESGRAAQEIASRLEQLNRQVDVFILEFTDSGSPDSRSPSLPVRVDVHRRGDLECVKENDPEREICIELIAADLQKDLGNLARLNQTLARGASIAGTGGLALAGYEAFAGNWLVTLLAGILFLLAGAWANHHKSLRAARIRQKWINRFSRLDTDQLSTFRSELDAKHPLLLTRLGLW